MPIIPPPEIRDIVEKTAQAVARNGPAFEARIRESEKQNSKFSFLNPMDPYRECIHPPLGLFLIHPILDYDERVAKLAQGDTPSTQQPQQAPQAADQEAARAQPEVPAPDRPPPPSFLHLKSHPPVSASDQDIIALTARFTAAYGRQAFTTPLASREARNFQFEFLRPGHSLHAYFNALVDAYSDIRVHAQNKYIPQLAYLYTPPPLIPHPAPSGDMPCSRLSLPISPTQSGPESMPRMRRGQGRKRQTFSLPLTGTLSWCLTRSSLPLKTTAWICRLGLSETRLKRGVSPRGAQRPSRWLFKMMQTTTTMAKKWTLSLSSNGSV